MGIRENPFIMKNSKFNHREKRSREKAAGTAAPPPARLKLKNTLFRELILLGFDLQTLTQFILDTKLVEVSDNQADLWRQRIQLLAESARSGIPISESELFSPGSHRDSGVVAFMGPLFDGPILGYCFQSLDPPAPMRMELVQDSYSREFDLRSEQSSIALRVSFGVLGLRLTVPWTDAAERLRPAGIDIDATDEYFQEIELRPGSFLADALDRQLPYYVGCKQPDWRLFLLTGVPRILN